MKQCLRFGMPYLYSENDMYKLLGGEYCVIANVFGDKLHRARTFIMDGLVSVSNLLIFCYC